MEAGEKSPTVHWGLDVGLSRRADVRAEVVGWCLRGGGWARSHKIRARTSPSSSRAAKWREVTLGA